MKTFFLPAITGLLLLLCGLTVTAAPGNIQLGGSATQVKLIGNSPQRLVYQITISDLSTMEVSTPLGNFTMLSAEGFGQRNTFGEPALPVYRRLIEFPFDASVRINIIRQHYQEIDLQASGVTSRIFPAQPPLSKSDDPAKVPFQFNENAYGQNRFTEDPFCLVSPVGVMRALNMARVDISPVQYNPVENKLRVYDVLEIEILFENANLAKTLELKQSKASPYFNSTYQLVENYRPMDPTEELITSAPVTYVIVSDPMFQTALQPFIAWKKKKGFNVIEGYTNNAAVGTTTTSIKSYLQGLYNSPPTGYNAPSFVLFVGDVAQIPAWAGSAGSHVTDLRYCEYTGDNLPEVYYGRFSATNLEELQPQIDKTLEYEQYTMPDPAFLGEAVMAAGADGSHQTYSNGQINYGTETYFNAAHNILSHTYLQPEPSGGNYASNIHTNVSNGVGYANYTAHCSESGWADPSFLISDIPNLSNAHKYCLMVGNCCLSSKFDSDCFAEEMLRAANKGSVGYIGGSNSTYWDEDYYWGCGFKSVVLHPAYNASHLGAYDGTFHENGEPVSDWFVTQGQMMVCGNYAVEESSSSRKTYYWEIYHLMGDPSLMIYYAVPPTLSATYQNTLMIGMSTLAVTTEPYAYVALSFNGTLLDAVCADAAGAADLSFSALTSVGNLDIVITKQNRQPHISTIAVIPASGPYVVYNSGSINDPVPAGNGNGQMDFGETDLLNITVKNVGVETAANVTGILTASDAYITITDASEDFGNIDPNQLVTRSDAFAVNISDAIPDQHTVPFTFTASDGTNSWVSHFNLVANAPVLTVGTMTVQDNCSSCNNDGILDAGETANLLISTSNTGHSSLADVNGTLAISGGTSPYLTLNTTGSSLGTLAAGSSATAIFSVTADPATPVGTPVDLIYSTSGAGYTVAADKQVVIGLIPTYVMTSGSVTTCPGNFFDSGGASGTYQSSESITETFYPSTPGAMIRFAFSSFETESGYDYLYIYNGTDISAPLIGTYHGTNGPGTVTASNASGALTFRFTSDGSVTRSGWEASISCYSSTQPPVAAFTASTTSTTINTTVTLTDQSTNIPTSWLWSITPGTFVYTNGTGETSQNPQVQFTELGSYSVTLVAGNAYGTDTESKPAYINVITCFYCATSFSNLTDDYISNVSLGSINNTSGSTSYSDFTALSTSLTYGSTASISVNVTVNGSWAQHCFAWIDWNQNCSFTDTGEAIDLGATPGTSGTHTLTGTVTVPEGAIPGLTRMRVSERFSQDPGSCDAATYGEAEDYTIVVEEATHQLNLSLLLESLYEDAGVMRKAQNESGDMFSGNVADQIDVELHDASHYATIVYTAANADLSINGQASVLIPATHSGSYYITVKHRNGIATVSSYPVNFNTGTINYSFNNADQAYGGNLRQISDSYWLIFGGDVNQDGIVDSGDMIPVDNSASGFGTGYIPEDANGDGLVDSGDMILIDNNASGFVSAITPL